MSLSTFAARTQSLNSDESYSKKYRLEGYATFYGSIYGPNRKTASGERFDNNAHTAAHTALPFGTIVRVTNLNNGLSVDVKINDRGPWLIQGRKYSPHPTRIIDLSTAAAKKVKMTRDGVVKCRIEILEMPEARVGK